ncbi:hypothetical protein TrRE_jg8793 [Triparma retinervis]|uniref:WW domain-containing protein n=1 Tax=Triparma retinervis TaxID=2557542 RepID=A0A9W6ZNV2_9STRA|nr:hypothetical protein TrRE_jg8793 [Triparma retinervis]
MNSIRNDTVQSTHKQRSKGKPKKKAMVPPPSDYHLNLASAHAQAKTGSRDPRLKNMPPATMMAREVDSTSEYKATSPAKMPRNTVSPDANFKQPPVIPGPAQRPKGKGYDHQRRNPPQHSTQPNPFASAADSPSNAAAIQMMRSNPTSPAGMAAHQNIKGGNVPKPKWPMNTPPRKTPIHGDNALTPNANTPLGPKSQGKAGRKLFAGEINRLEQEKEKARLLKEIEDEERRKEEERRRKEEEDNLRKMREKVGGRKVRPVPTDENDDIFSTASSRASDLDRSSLNFGMNTAKRFFGTNGLNAGGGGGNTADEMLNQGWWRFTDPETSWQYFWNEVTNLSQYERPANFETVKGDVFATARSKSGPAGADGNEGWKRYTDEETRMHYFYKESTDEGQWERPIGFDTMRGGFTAAQLTERREDGELPVEWSGSVVKYVDKETGYAYYYDEENNASSYDKPKGYTTSADPFASIREGGGWRMIPPADLAKRKGSDQLPVERIGGGTWAKYIDKESGWPYYINHETGDSTYDRPAGFETSANPFASMRGGAQPEAAILASTRSANQRPDENLNNNWQRWTDPATGAVYYHNTATDESTYDRPEGFQTVADPFGAAREGMGTATGTARSGMGTARSTSIMDSRSAAAMNLPPPGVLNVRRDDNQLPIEKLNSGWAKYVDPESGHPYYYNEENDESTFDRPENFKTSADAFAEARKQGVMPSAEVLNSVRGEKDKIRKVSGKWRKYVDPASGHPYWYNVTTEESTYERPENFKTDNDPFGTARSAMGTSRSAAAMNLPPAGVLSVRRDDDQLPVEKVQGGWQKFIDPESGHPYFYNEGLDESTYDRPENFKTSADAFAEARNDGIMPPADALNSVRGEKEMPVEVVSNGGFAKYKDPASGHFYYFNEETQESTYERPTVFVQTVADPFASAREEGIMPAPDVLSSARPATQKPDEVLNSGWQKFVDPESGHPYYWNSNTDESTYERPEGFQTNKNPFQSARGSARQTLPSASLVSSRRSSNEVGEKLNGGWVKYVDPESQTPYYHHAENDESQWEKPTNFVTSYNPFGTVKSRRRTGNMLPKMSENATLSDDIMATGGSSMDALDNAMMATFNKGALDALSETSPLKSKASAAVPALSLGGGGGRKSSIGRSGKTVLSSANDVLANVNAKLANMSVDEMREKSEGEGLMSTLRKNVDTGRTSGKSTNREGVVIPTLSLGGVGVRAGGEADSLDVALAQAGGVEQSWDAIADANESVAEYSSVLAGGDEENDGDAANAWVEYFDEEVGAKYYYNEITGEASWVDPTSM